MKTKLYDLLKKELFDLNFVLAVFEGGSKATGFNDDYSDLDLEIICEDDKVEDVFKVFEKALKDHFGILRSYRMAEPAWHGMSQCFYLVDQMPKHFYIDLAVIKVSKEERLTDTLRHGDAFVWFDKNNYIVEVDDSKEVTLERCQKLYKQAVSIDFLMMIETEKNLDRNRYLEAYPNFYRFVMSQLAVMLNLKNRPHKVDFGIRYSYRDYAQDDYDFLNRILKNKDINDLKVHYLEAKTYYLELKESLKSTYSL